VYSSFCPCMHNPYVLKTNPDSKYGTRNNKVDVKRTFCVATYKDITNRIMGVISTTYEDLRALKSTRT
jgi:hypothetical protein